MFGKKNVSDSYEEKVKNSKYEIIYQTLKDILNIKIETADDTGEQIVDYFMTVSAIKTRARIALDFIADFDKALKK